MSGGTVLALHDAAFGYNGRAAVQNVSFDVVEGEYVCLIGRNGCGKSTLIKGILGLLDPMKGTVELPGGLDSTAFLPQAQEGGGDFPATVWEVALSGRQGRGRAYWYSEADREAARKNLALMGVLDLAGRRIGNLSGGQRQRAFLARCLCREPRLLLLDEPYTGLDPEAAAELSEVLSGLCARGIAVLMSSHDLGAVAACASRVLVLEGGVVFDGDVGEWLGRYNRVDTAAPARATGSPASV